MSPPPLLLLLFFVLYFSFSFDSFRENYLPSESSERREVCCERTRVGVLSLWFFCCFAALLLWSYIMDYLRRINGASCSTYTINIHSSFWYSHFFHKSFGTRVHRPQTNEYMTDIVEHSMNILLRLSFQTKSQPSSLCCLCCCDLWYFQFYLLLSLSFSLPFNAILFTSLSTSFISCSIAMDCCTAYRCKKKETIEIDKYFIYGFEHIRCCVHNVFWCHLVHVS